MAPRYRLSTAAFIAPRFIPAESIIEYNGAPGPHMVPVNDEAEAAIKAYYTNNPHASINPVEPTSATAAPGSPSA